MSEALFERHRTLLDMALSAAATREAFLPWDDDPDAVNEILAAEGRSNFESYRNSFFYLDQPSLGGRIGAEISPWGLPLGVQYPKSNLGSILPAAVRAQETWTRMDADARAGVCMEILFQLSTRSVEIGWAAMHTTGASFNDAFAWNGPHAQARGLEALALAWRELRALVPEATVEEHGVEMIKRYRAAGRGVSLVVGNSTLPNLMAYPAIFANLMSGNAVIVKPHPQATLPLAITVGVARHVLKEAGCDPNLMTLVAEDLSNPVTHALVQRPEVKLVDYCGNGEFAAWISGHARQAQVRTASGAVNPVVIESTADPVGLMRGLIAEAAHFAGRSCLSPRVVFTSAAGIGTPGGGLSTPEFDEKFGLACEHFFNDEDAAKNLLGAMRAHEYDARVADAATQGDIVAGSKTIHWHEGQALTPLVIRVPASRAHVWMREWFGPVLVLVECESIADALTHAAQLGRESGALRAQVFSTDLGTLAAAEDALAPTGMAVELNLPPHSALQVSGAFTNLHGRDSATHTDSAFIAGRFRTLQTRSRK